MPKHAYSAIRALEAPFDGPRVVGAEFEFTVYVWDLKARKRVAVYDTPFDAGGRRLAINPRGDLCAVGSYKYGGLACYAAGSGEVVCVREDLRRPHHVNYSPDGKRLYCGTERGPMAVLNAETGKDLDKYPGIHKTFCSPHQPLELLCKERKAPYDLRKLGGKRIAAIERMSFAILDAAFGPDRFCVTESDGPVRCLGTAHGEELWRYTPRPGRHVLCLAHAQKASAFFGVEWPFERGGPKQLLRFDAETGTVARVATFQKPAAEQTFCRRGELLLTSEGELIDVMTGVSKRAFRFPARPREE